MKKQSGNFLLQALLALALIAAMIPMFTKKIARSELDSQMAVAVQQMQNAQTAARIYLRENLGLINYDTNLVAGNAFADMLEPYGLPLGFVPITPFGQEISLTTNKTADQTYAYLEMRGGDISDMQRVELVRRLGFYAYQADGNVYLAVPLGDGESEFVRRNIKNPESNAMMADLGMGGFDVENVGVVFARRGELDSAEIGTLSLFGIPDGRKATNEIESLTADSAVFQSPVGDAALTISRGDLSVQNISAKTVANFGTSGALTATDAAAFEFSMTASSTNFTGPARWDVRGNMITENVAISTEQMDISSFVNATRGGDVFIGDDFGYSTRQGIQVDSISVGNITLRDQTSAALLAGGTGGVILDIRPAGVSVLADVMSDQINNDDILIIADPADSGGDTQSCKSVIDVLGAQYDSKSLSQNIICQYVFWQRLERRIDIKQCLIDGRGGCE